MQEPKSGQVQAHPCLGLSRHISPSPSLPLPPRVPVSLPLCSLAVSFLASNLSRSPADTLTGSLWPSGAVNALGPASRAMPCPTGPPSNQLHLPMLLTHSQDTSHTTQYPPAEHTRPSPTTWGRFVPLGGSWGPGCHWPMALSSGPAQPTQG